MIKFFYTVDGPSVRNGRSLLVLEQLKKLLASTDVAVVVCASVEEATRCAPEGVAVFDGYPRNRFSPVDLSRYKHSPSWSKDSRFGVVVCSKTNHVSCAKMLAAIFLNPRESHYPWGEAKLPESRSARRRRKSGSQPREKGWYHAEMAS